MQHHEYQFEQQTATSGMWCTAAKTFGGNLLPLSRSACDASTSCDGLKELSDYLESAESSQTNIVDLNEYSGLMRRVLLAANSESRKRFAGMMDVVDKKTREVYTALEQAANTYHSQITEAINNNTGIRIVNDKYNQFKTQLYSIPVQQYITMPAQYTDVINSARNNINNRLSSVLRQPYKLGRDAYTHWEVEENTKAVVDSVYDLVMEVVYEELDTLKESLAHTSNSKITVYNPAQGEIQMDTYLPVDVTTLREFPRVSDSFDMTYLNKLRA